MYVISVTREFKYFEHFLFSIYIPPAYLYNYYLLYHLHTLNSDNTCSGSQGLEYAQRVTYILEPKYYWDIGTLINRTPLVGLDKLFRHNFENNRCTKEFRIIPRIIGSILQ